MHNSVTNDVIRDKINKFYKDVKNNNKEKLEQNIEEILLDIDHRLKFENLIFAIFEEFLSCKNIDEVINKSLEKIGKMCNVNRTYLFLFNNDCSIMNNTHEWCADDIEPQKENLQNIESKDLQWWMKNLLEGNTINIYDVSKMHKCIEKEMLEAQNIKSLLVIPLSYNNKLLGFLGFDNTTEYRIWKDWDLSLLKLFGNMVIGILEKNKVEKFLQESEEKYKDLIGNFYDAVIIHKNGKILLANKAALQYIEDKNIKNVQDVINKNIFDFLNIDDHKELVTRIEKIRAGIPLKSLEYEFKYSNGDIAYLEINSMPLMYENQLTTQTIIKNITERKNSEKTINKLAYYDTLTDLPNRTFFNKNIEKEIETIDKNQKLALIFFDIDRFKNINDTLGYHIGDKLIREISIRIKKIIDNNILFCRIDGDEFCLLSRINNIEEITDLANTILNLFSEPFFIDDYELFITLSMGIGVYPDNSENISTLIRNADIAMYKAKELGRNNFQLFDKLFIKTTLNNLNTVNKLRKALDKNEFILYYQPKINLKTNKIIGAEALIRWHDPDIGIIPPSEFISIAEETGLIIKMGEWVLFEACKKCKEWHDMGFNINVAINISAKQFEHYNFINKVTEIINKTGVNPKFIEFEITESIIMKDIDVAIEIINILKKIGITISLDDFGTGYSSLSYINKISVDTLKIDRSFIKDLDINNNSKSIITAIIAMAHSLNQLVLAEGIETKEQIEFLCDKKCDMAQGYYFSKPIDSKEFINKFKHV